MPRRDGTGPNGAGERTGRGLGKCAGANAARYGAGLGAGLGLGLGLGFACRRGFGRGSGRGFGFRQDSSKNPKELLEERKEVLKHQLSAIDKELQDL